MIFAATTLQADYEVPYLAHTTMEPQTCVAHVTDGRAEVWAPTWSMSWTGLPAGDWSRTSRW